MRIHLNRVFGETRFIITEESRDPRMVRRALPLQFEESEAPRMSETGHLEDANVQYLMDELWMMGIRPSRGVASTGQVEAQKAHIDDLRLVIGKLMQSKLIVEEP